jgi:uncharacterized protein YndB with AHSA1/START domain
MLRAEGDRCGIRFERRYDFTPEEVWSALTEPDRLTRWLADVAKLEVSTGTEELAARLLDHPNLEGR